MRGGRLGALRIWAGVLDGAAGVAVTLTAVHLLARPESSSYSRALALMAFGFLLGAAALMPLQPLRAMSSLALILTSFVGISLASNLWRASVLPYVLLGLASSKVAMVYGSIGRQPEPYGAGSTVNTPTRRLKMGGRSSERRQWSPHSSEQR